MTEPGKLLLPVFQNEARYPVELLVSSVTRIKPLATTGDGHGPAG